MSVGEDVRQLMKSQAPGYLDFIKAAFSAKPNWCWLPPNWLGLGLFSLLGLVNPGFWLLGLGVELAYLQTMAGNPRFQKLVRENMLSVQHTTDAEKLGRILRTLIPEARKTHEALQSRCSTILKRLASQGDPTDAAHPRSALEELLWVHLRLLQTKQNLETAMNEGSATTDFAIDEEITQLQKKITVGAEEEVLRSLQSRLDLLVERSKIRGEASNRIAYLDSELERIRDQVEWIGEQSMLATQQNLVSDRIDQVAHSFQETNRWLSENQKIYGEVSELLDTPPAMLPPKLTE